MPHIYHAYPSEEDLYALHQVNAVLVRRDMSSVIDISHQFPFSRLRKRSIAKAIKNNVVVQETVDFSEYWALLIDTLQFRHQAKPTHSLQEIESLVKAFPENIKLFLTLSSQGTLLAGIVVYINVNVVHVQYVGSSEEGRSVGAVDYLVDELMNKKYASKKWFSFGTSAEDAGRSLNQGLVAQKEGFGARGVISDHYQIIISR
ncbi:MAG: GNAT family N-acetyltransferase [Gammaproteobacteria bacterium]|nr:GNAT family N-acetyltransferase [Gammaproteobacteria bacterium]